MNELYRKDINERLDNSFSAYGVSIHDMDDETKDSLVSKVAAKEDGLVRYGITDGIAEAYVNEKLKEEPSRLGDETTENIIVSVDENRQYFEAQMSQDPDYPGVDIQFNDYESGDGEYPRVPRILFELCEGELGALVWRNSSGENVEDYEEYTLGVVNSPTGDPYIANARNDYFELIVPGSGRFAVFSMSPEHERFAAYENGGICVRFMPYGKDRDNDVIVCFGHNGESIEIKMDDGLTEPTIVTLDDEEEIEH